MSTRRIRSAKRVRIAACGLPGTRHLVRRNRYASARPAEEHACVRLALRHALGDCLGHIQPRTRISGRWAEQLDVVSAASQLSLDEVCQTRPFVAAEGDAQALVPDERELVESPESIISTLIHTPNEWPADRFRSASVRLFAWLRVCD